MRRCSSLPAVAAVLTSTALSHAGITLGPIKAQPGQSVRLVSKAEASDGKIVTKQPGATGSTPVRIVRERDLVWTFRDPLADGTRRGMVQVNQLETSTTIRTAGGNDVKKDTSPLTGKMFAMTKRPDGPWIFELDGTVPETRVREEIDELKIYLGRNWYPDRSLEAGDSWEFDPAWIKWIVHRDLRNAKTIGTMRLRQIRRAVDKETAVIAVTIRSTGSDYHSDGTLTEASVNLEGTMYVNLRTNLDELLELEGTIATGASTATTSTKATLPVKLKVTKKFEKTAGR